MFLIYINYLSDCINCIVILYVDDTSLYAPVNNDDTDRLLLQADIQIDSLHEWSNTNKMPFNTAKCEVIAFSSKGSLPSFYKIGEHPQNYADEIKYLGVVMQSKLRFNRHIAGKVNRAKKVLGCIKYALNTAPQCAKLLAYSSLCRPILDYANVLWDPAGAASVQELEAVQSRPIKFVKSIKGRHGITEGRTALGLQEVKDRRGFHRFAPMTQILSEDKKHAVLSSAYSEIVNDRNQISMTTRAAARGGLHQFMLNHMLTVTAFYQKPPEI